MKIYFTLKKNIFQELKIKLWNLLLPGAHYRKSKKSYLGKRKIITDENMEKQEKVKNTGKDKYLNKYKLIWILKNNNCNIW